MHKPILCIYHGNCADGFGAAWCVKQWADFNGYDIDFHAGVYQEDPPDVTGRVVIMVDFSYKRPVIEAMAEQAQSILILDHHKSAAEDLAGLPEPSGFDRPLPQSGIRAIFDMEHSGAGLAWDWFTSLERPPVIDCIEDRDLWKFDIPETRNVQAALFSYPYDFDVWTKLILKTDPAELEAQGAAIERKHHKDIAELLEIVQRPMYIAGHVVPVASLPYTLTSDAGHAMAARGYPFAACYWDTPEHRIFSLRSTDDGIDVSEIATQFGGGGHKHAAGFRVPRDHELAKA